jgi:hypothetical protein
MPTPWSQEQLATAAYVSIPTIKRLGASDGPLGGKNKTGWSPPVRISPSRTVVAPAFDCKSDN